MIIDLDELDPSQLPVEVALSAISMAELGAGPHATGDAVVRGRRQDRLQRAEAAFDPLPFDADAARAYGRIFAAVTASDRKARRARAVDLLIAATALAVELPLYTRNGDDFIGLESLVDIHVIGPTAPTSHESLRASADRRFSLVSARPLAVVRRPLS